MAFDIFAFERKGKKGKMVEIDPKDSPLFEMVNEALSQIRQGSSPMGEYEGVLWVKNPEITRYIMPKDIISFNIFDPERNVVSGLFCGPGWSACRAFYNKENGLELLEVLIDIGRIFPSEKDRLISIIEMNEYQLGKEKVEEKNLPIWFEDKRFKSFPYVVFLSFEGDNENPGCCLFAGPNWGSITVKNTPENAMMLLNALLESGKITEEEKKDLLNGNDEDAGSIKKPMSLVFQPDAKA